jgi:hypothetical protein
MLVRMSQSRSQVVEESKKKGLAAGAAVAGTVAVGVVLSPYLAVVGAVPAAVLGYRWWVHRAKNGIKF